jgi:hypothetical protein
MSTRRRRFPPGTGRSATNLKPRRCRVLRKASSGRVPDLLVRRIARAVAGDDAGGTGPGSRCWYTASASRDGPTPSTTARWLERAADSVRPARRGPARDPHRSRVSVPERRPTRPAQRPTMRPPHGWLHVGQFERVRQPQPSRRDTQSSRTAVQDSRRASMAPDHTR